MEIKSDIKKFFNWIWNSESIWSYIVFLILVFIVIKFIFFPILSLIMNTSLPLAIVESSSMDHHSISSDLGYEICGTLMPQKKFFSLDEYWNTCGNWYKQYTNITKEQFNTFNFKNGFAKGDLIIIYGKKNIEIGDVIIFVGGRAHPIIHRVISTSPIIQTKGDHNSAQLPEESNIAQSQIIGTAIARIPYIGWIKLAFVEFFNWILNR